MNSIKPIETTYKGYRFRSRLEARWAVFFDTLDIKWEYEPEGYQLSTREWYLPDFWLPIFGGGMYVEVKPTGGDFSKARQLSEDSRKKVWLAEGPPDFTTYYVFDFNPYADESYFGIPMWGRAGSENRMWRDPGFIGPFPEEELKYAQDTYFGHAVKASRAARFDRQS